MPSRITLGSITTTTGGANSPQRQSNLLHLGSGTRYKWLLSLITSGPILTANFCLIIVIPAFESGQVGLWTKADSVTAFDDLEIKGYKSQ